MILCTVGKQKLATDNVLKQAEMIAADITEV